MGLVQAYTLEQQGKKAVSLVRAPRLFGDRSLDPTLRKCEPLDF